MSIPFFKLFLWERFKTLKPKPPEFEAAEMDDFEDDNGVVRSVPNKRLKMRAQRLFKLK